MAKEMNRIFKHEGYSFNVKVALNVLDNRNTGGKVWHLVTVTDMVDEGAEKIVQMMVESQELVKKIDEAEKIAVQYVDNQQTQDTQCEEEKMLSIMGFE